MYRFILRQNQLMELKQTHRPSHIFVGMRQFLEGRLTISF